MAVHADLDNNKYIAKCEEDDCDWTKTFATLSEAKQADLTHYKLKHDPKQDATHWFYQKRSRNA